MASRSTSRVRVVTAACVALVISLWLSTSFMAAPPPTTPTVITIVNTDGPNEGFNDPTPARRVGGNSGRTVGEQRLIAFQEAADIWAGSIVSLAEIRIQASFDPLPCTATSGVLGAAGALQIVSNFPGAGLANVWYPVALANSLAKQDLIPGLPGTSGDDIVAFFNANLGGTGCLEGFGWYYGLDGRHGTQIDLVTVLLHEFGHGLGFASFVDETKGSYIGPPFLPDIYSVLTRDTTLGMTWAQMTKQQIKDSALNVRKLVWDGPAVTAAAAGLLAPGTPFLQVNSPGAIAGRYLVGVASFGPALTAAGLTGDLVLADDGVGTPSDACEPLLNNVAGQIALVDRGTCTFTVKVKNAQNAGAIAVIVGDNVADSPPAGLGGTDTTISIPSVRITLADANTFKGQLATGVNVTLAVDLSLLSGADPSGKVLLNATNPVQPGSSISHWDPLTSPNLLMEPAINDDLGHGLDLTLPQMKDIGWTTVP
jgi:hypothetical protein